MKRNKQMREGFPVSLGAWERLPGHATTGGHQRTRPFLEVPSSVSAEQPHWL